MKFCYLDESGTGNEPIAVMAGIIADASRMHIAKQQWNHLLRHLSDIIGRNISEIHTRDFYSGNSPWRELSGPQRSEIISSIFTALKERKHHVIYTAVDKNRFFAEFPNEPYHNDVQTLWRFMALHITLSIQKRFQRESRNKGHTVLIFDNENREQKRFTDLIVRCPDWTDSYYAKKKTQDKLDQIVDVPHFVDSQDVGLIQAADFLCFFLRKHIELSQGMVSPAYHDEREKVATWIQVAFNQSIAKSSIFPSKGRCPAANLFWKYAPDWIR